MRGGFEYLGEGGEFMHMTWEGGGGYNPDLTLCGQTANINIISVGRDGRCRPKKVGFPQVKSKKNGILFLVQNSLYIDGELNAYDMEVQI